MNKLYTPEQVREAEQPLLATMGEQLMQHAAFAVASFVQRTYRPRRVVVLVGPGNNGGDALYAAAFLKRRGVQIHAITTTANPHAGGVRALGQQPVQVAADEVVLPEGDLLLDGLLGIGAQPPLRPTMAALTAAANASGMPIVAIDIPTGVDPMTGRADENALVAAQTVTFGTLKPAHIFSPEYCGEVVLRGLGIDQELAKQTPYAEVVREGCWPVPDATSNKYTGGVLGVLAGSTTYPGAALLTVAGAVRASSPMVRYFGQCREEVVRQFPSVVAGELDPDRCDALVVGPGQQTSEQQLLAVLNTAVPLVLDADALTALSESAQAAAVLRKRSAFTVLTPHDGEYRRLLGHAPQEDRVAAARELARQFNCAVLLKGRVTIVVDPDPASPARFIPALKSWAATPGSGDVLAGVVGALVAYEPSVESVALAAAAHARAAETFAAPCDARQLADGLSVAIAQMIQGGAAPQGRPLGLRQ